MVHGQEINFPGGWVGGRVVWIGIKAQLRPAKAGAGAWPELGNEIKILEIMLKYKFRNEKK